MADAPTVHDRTIPGPHGTVPIRVYRPVEDGAVGLVWMHGGAFRFGDLDMPESDATARRLAARGVTVVSVDYRLANDGVRFPVPGDDVLAVWRACAGEDGPPRSWHIGGASAGANLAASISLQARDGLAPMPESTVLVYPVLHHRPAPLRPQLASRIVEEVPEDLRFPPALMDEYSMNYVGDAQLLRHPYAFPGEGDAAGLPPTLIVNAELDDLRPSGEAYAAALALAGVELEALAEPGAMHGHLDRPDEPAASRTVERIARWLREHRGTV